MKHTRKNRKLRQLKKGGNCGCTKIFQGGRQTSLKRGNLKRGGGVSNFLPPTFLQGYIPQDAYYPKSLEQGGPTDPTSPNMQPSTRLFPDMKSSGGSKRRTKRRTKKKRGGSYAFSNTNTLTSLAGAYDSYKILNGGVENPDAPLTNHLGSKYTENFPPIA